MKGVGNAIANKVWEASVPAGVRKPQPAEPRAGKDKWIRDKYERKSFVRKAPLKSPQDLVSDLFSAASQGNVELAIETLARGAEYLQADPTSGRSALHIACEAGHLLVAMALIQTASCVRYEAQLLDMADKDGRTAMDLAKASGKEEITTYLEEVPVSRS
jgi:ankyrin repeat protein